ncbi:MAG TPA: NAD(P)/FAD-dependent oxidoreductase, partial [Oscillospiraceae bacterium]|nr:NAD(P)/FAD-dependent oxidoreductase [Oscillospiraceae bacterium]
MAYDVAIVGAGVIGCSLARELSRYDIKVALIEKENDVAMGTTRANSAIIHAGYDPEPGTLMAKYNVEGNRLTGEIAEELGVPFGRCGSLVLAFGEEDMETVRALYDRGVENGVPGMQILSGEAVRGMEPNLAPEVVGALFAPSAGIINPWEFALLLAQNAVRNGVDLLLEHEVSGIEKDGDGFVLHFTDKEDLRAAYVVNAAGVESDEIAAMVGDHSFSIDASKGQYYLLDKSQGALFHHVLFQCPGPLGKGILVSPTVHGNLIVGPDANPGSARGDVSTDRQGLDHVIAESRRTTAAINFRENVRNFAGLRAQPSGGDFIVGPSGAAAHFYNIAGIKSPGLTAAPAIAADAARYLAGELGARKKDGYTVFRKETEFKFLTEREKAAKIGENPLYGRVICRCETVTEGEIVDALHAPITPRTLDAVKRRCGAGMGRCQGGFCGPRVLEIISRELHIPPEEVLLDRGGSYILIERVAPDTDVPRIPYKALDSNVGVSGADTPGYIMEWDFRKGADNLWRDGNNRDWT